MAFSEPESYKKTKQNPSEQVIKDAKQMSFEETNQMVEDLVDKALLKSSWFKNDTPMSDQFIRDISLQTLNPQIIFTIMYSMPTNYIKSLENYIFNQLENLPEKLATVLLYNQSESIQFMLKNGSKDYTTLEISKSEENPAQVIKALDKALEKNNIKEVGLNIFSGIDVEVAMALGEYFKEKKVDLQILGFCGDGCARYMLLGARNISISPYGFIFYSTGSLSVRYEEMLKAEENEGEGQEMLKAEENEGEGQEMVQNSNWSNKDADKVFNESQNKKDLKKSILNQKDYQEALFYFLDLSNDGFKEYNIISKETSFLSESKKSNLYKLSDRLGEKFKDRKKGIMASLSESAELEKNFFGSVNLQSELDYSFIEFLDFMNYILESPLLNQWYPDYTRRYDIRLPLNIVPSESLLKKLGLNIVKGANDSSKTFERSEGIQLFFSLNESQIETCGFFKESQSSSENQECLKQVLEDNLSVAKRDSTTTSVSEPES